MKSLLYDQRLSFFLILLVSIGIGFQNLIYKIATIALVLQWILIGNYRKKIIKLSKDNFAIGLIGLYFLYAISFFWSANQIVAIDDIILKSPFLLFPLVISSVKKLTIKQLNIVFLSFSFTSLLLNLSCFGNALFSFLKTGLISDFYYINLPLNMHVAYQSMFTCFSIVILVYLFIKKKFISSWLAYCTVAIQIVFVLLLASRMQILILVVITPLYLITYYYKKKQISFGLLYTALIFVFSFLIISIPSSVNDKEKRKSINIAVDNENSNPRKLIWAAGIEVIKNNWLIGTGIGQAKEALSSRYSQHIIKTPNSDNLLERTMILIQKNNKIVSSLKEQAINSNTTFEKELKDYANDVLISKNNKYKDYLQKQYNFHNQYLQTFGEIGIFGFLILCYLLAYLFIQSIRNKDYLIVFFLLIVGGSFLTESMLERQAGVAFFAFFYVLLIGRLSHNKLS